MGSWQSSGVPTARACDQGARQPTRAGLDGHRTAALIADIRESLGIQNILVVQTWVERENLFLEVKRMLNRQEKEHAIVEILTSNSGSGIIYCATVKRVNEIYEWLHGQAISAKNTTASQIIVMLFNAESAQHNHNVVCHNAGFGEDSQPAATRSRSFGSRVRHTAESRS